MWQNWLEKINEFNLHTYKSSALYKQNKKLYHDRKTERREFYLGDLSCYTIQALIFLGKLRPKWFGPFIMMGVFLHGVIELKEDESALVKVNYQLVKHYVVTTKKRRHVRS